MITKCQQNANAKQVFVYMHETVADERHRATKTRAV